MNPTRKKFSPNRGASRKQIYQFMNARIYFAVTGLVAMSCMTMVDEAWGQQPARKLNVEPAAIATDKAVKYDYDIVYVRAPRFGDERPGRWAEVFNPMNMDPGADLMLLHPDGREEVLVKGGDGAVADPYVSFDGRWIYFAKFHDQTKRQPYGFPRGGADIFKIHVESRKLVQLTHQERTPNTGILSVEEAKNIPVFNLGPCPAPGGKIVFTSTRNLFEAPKTYTTGNFQLFVMDDDGANVEMIGHLNIGGALHPTILRDGRVMFSSYESQGMRDLRNWGLWFIYPDGTGWGPIVSSFQGAEAYHFQTQLSDGHIVFEAYYNANNFGFGTLYKMPPGPKESYSAFGPGDRNDPRNPPQKDPRRTRFSFTPYGLQSVTKFVSQFDSPAGLSDPADPKSRRVGKFTHPSGAPDNHLLTVWSAGAVNSNGSYKKDWLPWPDTGIYLIKDGTAIDEPGQMLVIKNDPNYNEQWPRAVVPYQRTYGVAEPDRHVSPRNDGTASPHLPAGSPFGLVGTSSFYKRESITGGTVPEGSVTAVAPKKSKLAGHRPFNSHTPEIDEWFSQGSDCGLYDNSEIHAMRLIAQEPATQGKRKFWNWGAERYRILGEIPVRHFLPDGKQPLDPDGNPDTSVLARIPADTSFTTQLLDKDGMMLTMAQTWHQVRPGEIRNDCGGCHAHSQKPTPFELTSAAKPSYKVLDLALQTPLLTAKQNDQSGQRWDEKDETGLRFEKAGVVNVEFHRDILPIFQRSCTDCHSKDNPKPEANLVLDDLEMVAMRVGGGKFRTPPGEKAPLSYAVLAGGHFERYGHSHLGKGWVMPQVSRYVRVYQSRRSLLAWKILGRRTDGWSNDDFPTATDPADPKTLQIAGKPVDLTKKENMTNADVDFTESIMPPPKAVKEGKVKPLTDEDRRTIFRWIDLGCPIDFAAPNQKADPNHQASGWHTDEIRPTLTVTLPGVSERKPLSRILVGMHDAYTGLDMESFEVQADFAVNDVPAGKNLASKFQPAGDGVWELRLSQPLGDLPRGRLNVAIKDKQGNITRVERSFSAK